MNRIFYLTLTVILGAHMAMAQNVGQPQNNPSAPAAVQPAPQAPVTAPVAQPASNLTIDKDRVVKFHYTLKVGSEVVETTEGKEPLQYTHGQGALIPGLENALVGLKAGDEKTVIVEPKDGYGEVIKEAIKEFTKDTFPKDMTPQKGMILEFKGPNGESIPGIIEEIKDDKVMVNFNHPLAGKILEFQVKIVEVK
jgi:FKBP-type peptidyl-prolyl cis-trans isomerase 2